ncbi:SH3 domain-containing protein [Aureimonas ureilytica]|uniref:SH3 domain-containing protein n=1 Tax=Aureimonas ureilytica TaxID=401562 RepID=UPI000382F00A|nr:SH3 domain-containing protein [Aureimonas ureilytica]
MTKARLFLLALAGTALAPGIASAATAIATTNVNLRAGPSTAYPPVNVVRGGEEVRVYGCLANRAWCDVTFYGQRGWISSNYLAYVRGGQRYTGPRVVPYIGAPTVTYSFGRYWDDHYRDRDFYRDRRRWDGIYGPRIFDRGPPPRPVRERGYYDAPPPPPPPGWDRRDRFERDRDRFEGRRDRERFEDGPPPPPPRHWEERRDWDEDY